MEAHYEYLADKRQRHVGLEEKLWEAKLVSKQDLLPVSLKDREPVDFIV